MQHPSSDKLIDRLTRREGRVELNQRLWPERPRVHLGPYVVADLLVADADEALDVRGVVVDEVPSQAEDIHELLLSARNMMCIQAKRLNVIRKRGSG